MNTQARIGALLLGLFAAGWPDGEEPSCFEPRSVSFLSPLAPIGGWNPYGGGLLRWWDPHCFPRSDGPDDYCRKPLPSVCWPSFPPNSIWGPPAQSCSPHDGCRPANPESR